MAQDIRWQQRFSNYQKALAKLKEAAALQKVRELSSLEKQGVIQGFEYTHELAWKTLKDFLEHRGATMPIYGSKDATKQAFALGIISHNEHAEIWMQMLQSRNLSSHTYDEDMVETLVKRIFGTYLARFQELDEVLSKLLEKN